MFIVDTFYIVDPALAEPHKEAHKVFVQQHTDAGIFLYAGPKLDKTGGIIVMNANDVDEVTEMMQKDAYISAGIVGMNISGFNPLFSSVPPARQQAGVQ